MAMNGNPSIDVRNAQYWYRCRARDEMLFFHFALFLFVSFKSKKREKDLHAEDSFMNRVAEAENSIGLFGEQVNLVSSIAAFGCV